MTQIRRAWLMGITQVSDTMELKDKIVMFIRSKDPIPQDDENIPRPMTRFIWEAYKDGFSKRGRVTFEAGAVENLMGLKYSELAQNSWESPTQVIETVRHLPIDRRLDALTAIVKQNMDWQELGFAKELLQEIQDNEYDLFAAGKSAPAQEHILKLNPGLIDKIVAGSKKFELRCNDRDYKEGDILVLRETLHTGAEMVEGAELKYTGRQVTRQVGYIQQGSVEGLQPGWVALAFDPDYIGKDCLEVHLHQKVMVWIPGASEDILHGEIIHYDRDASSKTLIKLDNGTVVTAADYAYHLGDPKEEPQAYGNAYLHDPQGTVTLP